MLLSEDYPHRIPAKAYLRWRENWVFYMFDTANRVYVLCHMSVQPTFGTARYTCELSIDGERYNDAHDVAAPDDFENLRAVTVGPLTFDFVKPQTELRVRYRSTTIEFDIRTEARMHLFDYLACESANPDQYSTAENVSCGGHDFRHQNQLLAGEGMLRFVAGPRAGTSIALSGPAYRDHSWGLRNDQLTASHTWSFMIFDDHVFHLQEVNSLRRPESWVQEGYVGTRDGNLALRDIAVHHLGRGPADQPQTSRFELTDTAGGKYTVTCDVAHAYERLTLYSQKPTEINRYQMIENVCPCTWEETGKTGIALVEIGQLMGAQHRTLG